MWRLARGARDEREFFYNDDNESKPFLVTNFRANIFSMNHMGEQINLLDRFSRNTYIQNTKI